MLPEFMNLLRKFYFMRAAARNAKRQSDFFDRLKRAVNLHVIHGAFEAVEKLTFSEQPLDRNHAFDRISKKNRALQAHFSSLVKIPRYTPPEFMNLLRKFYFMRAAARSKRVEMQLFRQTAKRSRNRPLFSA